MNPYHFAVVFHADQYNEGGRLDEGDEDDENRCGSSHHHPNDNPHHQHSLEKEVEKEAHFNETRLLRSLLAATQTPTHAYTHICVRCEI